MTNEARAPGGRLMACCDAWENAGKPWTDNEGHGTLRWNMPGERHRLRIGQDLPMVKFCPWCGTPKGEQKGEGR